MSEQPQTDSQRIAALEAKVERLQTQLQTAGRALVFHAHDREVEVGAKFEQLGRALLFED